MRVRKYNLNTYYYAIFLFCATFTMFALGYTPLLFSSLEKYQTLDYEIDFFSLIVDYLTSWEGLLVGGATVVTLIATGFNLIVIVPFVLLSVILNLLVFPITSINAGGLPPEVALVIGITLNLFTFLVIISFVRTGE